MGKFTIPKDELMSPGHMGCLGCGACQAMRYALKAFGRKTMITVPACCWAVMPGVWPNTCIQIPMLYHAFEVTGAAISGVRAALDALGQDDVTVVGWAGDGGTADIGIQALSGMVERGTDVFYIMYDNEAYMNTGIQRSSSTLPGAWTTTTPVGTTDDYKKMPKKNMVEIMVAHKIPYTATASTAYPEDLIRKIEKGKTIKGPKFIQIFAPCPTGWKSDPALTVELAKLAVTSHAFPIYEVEYGRYTINKKPKKTPLMDYMRKQGRFRHLTEEFILDLEKKLDKEWELLLRKEEFTKDL